MTWKHDEHDEVYKAAGADNLLLEVEVVDAVDIQKELLLVVGAVKDFFDGLESVVAELEDIVLCQC